MSSTGMADNVGGRGMIGSERRLLRVTASENKRAKNSASAEVLRSRHRQIIFLFREPSNSMANKSPSDRDSFHRCGRHPRLRFSALDILIMTLVILAALGPGGVLHTSAFRFLLRPPSRLSRMMNIPNFLSSAGPRNPNHACTFSDRTGIRMHVAPLHARSRPSSDGAYGDGIAWKKLPQKLVKRIIQMNGPSIPVKWIELGNDNNDTTPLEGEPERQILPVRHPLDHRRLPGARFISKILSFPRIELNLGILVLFSSILVAIGTLKSVPCGIERFLQFGENTIGGVFFIEYLLRWYCQGLKLGHLFQPFVIIDFLSCLPLLFQVAPGMANLLPLGAHVLSDNMLINLRLLRLLRLQRFFKDYETFQQFQITCGFKKKEVKLYQLQLARILLSFFTLISVSTGLIYTAEHESNPAMPDYFTALYFGLTTLTTVGFGDIAPVTANGRLAVCGTILAGVAIIPAQVSGFFEALMTHNREMEAEKRQKTAAGAKKDKNMPQFYEKYRLDRSEAAVQCNMCSAKPHRADATFCWSCGSALPATDRKTSQ